MLFLNDCKLHVNHFFRLAAIFFQLLILIATNAEKSFAITNDSQNSPGNYTTRNANCTQNITNLFALKNSFTPFYIPNTQFRDEFGGNYVIKAFEGKTKVIYFWASWCMPCLDDLLALDRLKANATFRNIHDIEVIPISVDFKELSEVRSSTMLSNLKNLVLFNDSNKQLYGQFRVNSLPTTFIINKSNNVVFGFEGSIKYDCDQFLNELISIN